MKAMVMLMGGLLLVPQAVADEPSDEDLAKQVLDQLEPLLGEEMRRVLEDILAQAGVCFGSSVPLNDGYVDFEYHEDIAKLHNLGTAQYLSVRTNPSQSGVNGLLLVIGFGAPCEDFYHEGDAAFTVGT